MRRRGRRFDTGRSSGGAVVVGNCDANRSEQLIGEGQLAETMRFERRFGWFCARDYFISFNK
jgi:hypothetical protein